MDPLRIYLLGGFRLERGGVSLSPIASRAGRSLFAYLVVNRDRQHLRDYLAGLVWPDLSEAQARRRLSQALWQVRDVLGELPGGDSYVRADANFIGFNADARHWVDVDEFEGGLRERTTGLGDHPLGRLSDIETVQRCVELYRGDFLTGFYEDWVLIEQQRLRDQYVRALGDLVSMNKARGEHEEALGYARVITHHEPLREEAHREVMRLTVLLGRPTEALAQYDRCRLILAEELGTEPDPATEELYQRIQKHRHVGLRAASTGDRPSLFDHNEVPFVGRRRERSKLIDRIERALGGRGGLVLVEGDPGVGKTRLLTETATDALWRGFEVLWGTCANRRPVQPYQPLAEALEPVLTELRVEALGQHLGGLWLRESARVLPGLARLLPELPNRVRLRDGEEPQRMREALARVFQALGSFAPTMVVLDDLQWADSETLEALVQIADVLAGSRLLMCVVYRADEIRENAHAWRVIRQLDQKLGLGRVMLSPLSVFEVDEMARDSGGTAVKRSVVAQIHRETGGNPMFVLETLRALAEGSLRSPEGESGLEGGADLSELPLADTVQEVIAHRIGLLDSSVRSVLEAIAVQGTAIRLPTTMETCRLSPDGILNALQTLLHRGLIVASHAQLEFSHDQVRRVAYDLTPYANRVILHSAIGEVLVRDQPGDLELIAHHFYLGERWAMAFDYLNRAGNRAVSLDAYGTAASHFELAAEVSDEAAVDGEALLKLLAAWETSLAVLARRDEQEVVLQRMRSLELDAAWAAEVSARHATFLTHTDRFEEAVVESQAALTLTEPYIGPTERAELLTVLGRAMAWSGGAVAALIPLKEAAALQQGTPQKEADVRTVLGSTLAELQRYPEAEEQLQRSLRAYDEVKNLRGRAEVLGLLATIHMERGKPGAAEKAYRSALDICRAIGYRHGAGVNQLNLGNQLYILGRITEALELYEQAVRVFRAIGNQRGEAKVLANAAAVRHLILADDGVAWQEAEAALDYFQEVGDPSGQAQSLEILAGISARRGHLEDARNQLNSGLNLLKESQHRWLEVHLMRSLALLDLREGLFETALSRIGRAQTAAQEMGLSDVVEFLAALRGRTLLAMGKAREAALATDHLRADSRHIEHSYLISYWRYEVLLAAGRVQDAQTMLKRAHQDLSDVLEGLTVEQRNHAWSAVPENRAIQEAWKATQPVTIRARLPLLEAPSGRPLRQNEWVEILWTIGEPADDQLPDPIHRRRHRLARLMREARSQGAAPTVDDLAAALQVSRTTVRRDLAAMRQAGLPVFTRGARSA